MNKASQGNQSPYELLNLSYLNPSSSPSLILPQSQTAWGLVMAAQQNCNLARQQHKLINRKYAYEVSSSFFSS